MGYFIVYDAVWVVTIINHCINKCIAQIKTGVGIKNNWLVDAKSYLVSGY